jgi:hypothetical protein
VSSAQYFSTIAVKLQELSMTEESQDQEPKRVDSLEAADNEQSNRQLMWSIGVLVVGLLIILVIYR